MIDEEGPLSFSEAMYVARCMSEGMHCPPSMISRFYNPPAQKLIITEPSPMIKIKSFESAMRIDPMQSMDMDILKPKSKKYDPLGLNNF